jgi:hypothetical protein
MEEMMEKSSTNLREGFPKPALASKIPGQSRISTNGRETQMSNCFETFTTSALAVAVAGGVMMIGGLACLYWMLILAKKKSCGDNQLLTTVPCPVEDVHCEASNHKSCTDDGTTIDDQ